MANQTSGTCPACGEAVLATDTHCMSCGSALNQPTNIPAAPVAKAPRPLKGDAEFAARHEGTLQTMHKASVVSRSVLGGLAAILIVVGYFGVKAILIGVRSSHKEFTTVGVKAGQAERIALIGLYSGSEDVVESRFILAIPEGALAQDDKVTLRRVPEPEVGLDLPDGEFEGSPELIAAACIEAKSDQTPEKPFELTVEVTDAGLSRNILVGIAWIDVRDGQAVVETAPVIETIGPEKPGARPVVLCMYCPRPARVQPVPSSPGVEMVRPFSFLNGHYSHDKHLRIIPDTAPDEDTPIWFEWEVYDWGSYYIYQLRPKLTQ